MKTLTIFTTLLVGLMFAQRASAQDKPKSIYRPPLPAHVPLLFHPAHLFQLKNRRKGIFGDHRITSTGLVRAARQAG